MICIYFRNGDQLEIAADRVELSPSEQYLNCYGLEAVYGRFTEVVAVFVIADVRGWMIKPAAS